MRLRLRRRLRRRRPVAAGRGRRRGWACGIVAARPSSAGDASSAPVRGGLRGRGRRGLRASAAAQPRQRRPRARRRRAGGSKPVPGAGTSDREPETPPERRSRRRPRARRVRDQRDWMRQRGDGANASFAAGDPASRRAAATRAPRPTARAQLVDAEHDARAAADRSSSPAPACPARRCATARARGACRACSRNDRSSSSRAPSSRPCRARASRAGCRRWAPGSSSRHVHHQDVAPSRRNVRRAPAQHLEQDAAERVDVGRAVDLVVQAAALLGRHVRRRSEDDARARLRTVAAAPSRGAASRCRSPAPSRARRPATSGPGTRNRFSGLRSRWTISIACDAATARAAWIAMSTALPTPSRSRVEPPRQRLAVEVLHHDVRDFVRRSSRRRSPR